MTARENRPPHLGVLAGASELAAYAEVTLERARQLTAKDWWTVPPLDFVGGRFVYSYPDAVKLLRAHHYPKRLYPHAPRTRKGYAAASRVPPERKHLGVLAGVGEIAKIAKVPTSRAAQMMEEPWWNVPALDYLAGGTVYPYPAAYKLLTKQGYPRRYKTIGERLEAQRPTPPTG